MGGRWIGRRSGAPVKNKFFAAGVLLAAVTFGAGIFVGATITEYFGESDLAHEIAENEATCATKKGVSAVAYPVTKWGELRGCLHVPEAEPSWSMSRSYFVRIDKQ